MRFETRTSGVVLVELLVVLVVLAVLQAVAAPAFTSVLNSIRVSTAADHLHSGLTLARSEAVKRNSRSVLCKSSGGGACAKTGAWNQGWIVFHDANNDGERDPDETLIAREDPLPSSISLVGNTPVKSYVSYTSTGATAYVTGAFQAGTFTVCANSSSPVQAQQIVISSTGRPRASKSTEPQCP